jgi:acyl-CoA dehydrogenase
MGIALFVLAIVIGVPIVVLAVPAARRAMLSRPLLKVFRRVLPQMSDTERDALEAGTVWWEGELFRGNPQWGTLAAYPRPGLTAREQAFMDREVEVVCAMVDDWDVTQHSFDLPESVWTYLKHNGFLGMIIPESHGGLGFSAFAHSQVVTKLSTRSSALSVSVMVPNSLGPAELLLHYGTDAQKAHYLPRLARGEDVPAFALTSPWAGSDAAAIPDRGIVCRGMWEGQEVLGMRVSWDKRYITLAPVCTLLGLAFRLYDPDHLLGDIEDIGITCALVPHDHPGVDTGRRHFPLNAMFMNGPTRGKDVFMPLDFIIGGPARAGHGWRMLMECLAAGRSISLPSSNTGMCVLTARAVGAYARIRTQFRLPVGKFEGVEEALTRIAGHTYMMDAARIMTAGGLDQGAKPSVVSAIVKYHITERARMVVNDGMDVIGGKGICLGPANFLGRAYQQLPIGITVEGANILTRSLIIFGQGAIRCHPYVLKEMQAARDPDPKRGLLAFDDAFWSHVRFIFGNAGRAFGRAVTGARWVAVQADVDPGMKHYYQHLSRLSAGFAVAADVAMLVLGGELKRREKLSARLGDVLSQMYLVSCTLKRFEDEGRQQADAALVHWSVQDAMMRAQTAFEGVLANFPNRLAAGVLRLIVLPGGAFAAPPSDALGHEVARQLMTPGGTRDRLTATCFLPDNDRDPVGAIEAAFLAAIACEPLDAKVRALEKSGALTGSALNNVRDATQAAYAAGGLTEDEYAQLKNRDILRDRVIAVDDFPFDYGRAIAEEPLARAANG